MIYKPDDSDCVNQEVIQQEMMNNNFELDKFNLNDTIGDNNSLSAQHCLKDNIDLGEDNDNELVRSLQLEISKILKDKQEIKEEIIDFTSF